MSDAMGDRMKLYEGIEASRRCMPLLPVLARLDGKNFSTFTKGLARPYDKRLSDLMILTTRHLVEVTNAVCGYTQSDEITLAWYSDSIESQIYFDGKIQKMTSTLAAEASVLFVRGLPDFIPEKATHTAVFDCRVWTVPTLDEGANVFMWREFDATKNSITQAAQVHYSHLQLNEKNGSEKQEMLFAKGINWNDYPRFFKRGTYIQRQKRTTPFTTAELESLPEKHHARTNSDLVVERTSYVELDLPPLNKVANRVGVIFCGEEPVLLKEME